MSPLQIGLGLLALPFLLFLPGYLLLSVLRQGRPAALHRTESAEPPVAVPVHPDVAARAPGQRRASPAESWMGLPLSDLLFQSILASTLLVSALAFPLAEIGIFSLPLLLGLVAGLVILLGVLVWRRRSRLALPPPAWPDLMPLLLALLSGWLAFHPYEFILGSGDAGAYINIGATIADTGGIILYNRDLAALDPEMARQELLFPEMPMPSLEPGYHHFPGYVITDLARGQITPQFYHLFPTWIAIGDALLGLRGGFYVTPMFGVLAALAVYFAGKTILGRWAGFLGSLLLSVNMVQVWFSRYPTSEIITQYFLFAAIYLLALWLEPRPMPLTARWTAGLGVLAAGTLATLLVIRVDSLLALLPIALWGLYMALFRRQDLRARWPFFVTLVLATLHLLVYFSQITARYTLMSVLGLYYYLLHPGTMLTLAALGCGGFLAIALLARRGWLKRHERLLRGVLIALLAGLALFGYFIWPAITSPQTVDYYTWPEPVRFTFENDENLVRLGWYMTPVGLLLGFLGLLEALRREPPPRITYLLAVFLLYGVVYTYQTADSPVHIHVMRRYVPEVIPALALGAGYALQRLGQVLRGKAGLVLAAALGLGLLVLTALPTWPLREYVEYAGAIDQVTALASRFTEQDVLLYTDVEYGTLLGMPLQYIFHRPGFVLQQEHPDPVALNALLRTWENQGRQVYLIVADGRSRLSPGDFTMDLQETVHFTLPRLEQTTDRRPSQIGEVPFLLEIYRLHTGSTGATPGPHLVDIGQSDYPFIEGGFFGKEVMPEGQTFRWTKGNAELVLPGSWFSPTEAISLSFSLGHNRFPDMSPPQMEVLLDGHLLADFPVEFGFHTYAFAVPPELADELVRQKEVHLRLYSDVWQPATSGIPDERELGVFVDWIKVMTLSQR
jgi:hypothetical protein